MFCVCISQFLLNVYNPLARPVRWSVHLPVNGTVYNVTDSDHTPVDNQVGVVHIPLLICGDLSQTGLFFKNEAHLLRLSLR